VAYRLRLKRERFDQADGVSILGKQIWLDDYTEYDADDMRRSLRRRLVFWDLKKDKDMEIEGQLPDGRWVAISPWLRQERRKWSYIAESLRPSSGAAVDEEAALRESALTTVAFHLRDCRKLTYDSIGRDMKRLGFDDVYKTNVARQRGYGADSAKKLGHCPACGRSVSGRKRKKPEAPP